VYFLSLSLSFSLYRVNPAYKQDEGASNTCITFLAARDGFLQISKKFERIKKDFFFFQLSPIQKKIRTHGEREEDHTELSNQISFFFSLKTPY